MKIRILVLLLFCSIAFAQRVYTPVYIEHNSIATDTIPNEIISYRIPFDNLLFTKEKGNYVSKFSITFEIYKKDEFLKREILNETVKAENYDATLSKDKFFENYIVVQLEPGEYKLKTVLNLNTTEIQYRDTEVTIKVDSLDAKSFLSPIIVRSEKGVTDKFVIVNYGNKIPFAPKKYDLLITLPDSSIKKIDFEIVQFDKVIKNESISVLNNSKLELNKINNLLVLEVKREKNNLSNFLISDFSNLLFEGEAELRLKYNNQTKKIPLLINWFNKPEVLNNPEYSIKLLQYIEKDQVIGELLSNDEKLYLRKLISFWNEKYPTNGMNYNYAMAEYYSRADYAYKNFSSLNTLDGAERDRGRIYITYGKPTSVERNYNEMNEVVEVWTYDNLGRTFIFKDKKGTGKFDLSK